MSWRHVVISRPGKLSLNNGNLKIQQEKEDSFIPLEDISSLVIESGRVTVTSSLLSEMSGSGIAVYFCDKKHIPNGCLLEFNGHSRQIHMIEVQMGLTKPFCKRLWQAVIQAKIANQSRVLDHFNPDIKNPLKGLDKHVTSGDRGNLEAVAARWYWHGLFGKGFSRRKECIQNACLDYGYSLVRGLVARTLVGFGFFPSIGIHHCSQLNNFNLADDFLEPFRPAVDGFVRKFVNENKGELGSALRKKLYRIFAMEVRIRKSVFDLATAVDHVICRFRSACEEQDPSILELPQWIPFRLKRYE